MNFERMLAAPEGGLLGAQSVAGDQREPFFEVIQQRSRRTASASGDGLFIADLPRPEGGDDRLSGTN